MIKPNSVIGILGGGQLGRMTALAAAELGYKVHVFTPEQDSPTEHICFQTTNADYMDESALTKFASSVELVSFEFENIPYKTLEILEQHAPVFPSSNVIKICQNRVREKDFINAQDIATAPYKRVVGRDELVTAIEEIGVPSILKTAEMGYDGKGQFKILNAADLPEIEAGREYVLEGFVPFSMEISVLVARGKDGKTACYAPCENIHKNHILDITIAPARISDALAEKAKAMATKIANGLELVGILAVEMFVIGDDLVVNELAPRPHNSGHHTTDSCATGQFEQFVRAICGLPLGSVQQLAKAEMKNLIGADVLGAEKYLSDANAKLHLYGKNQAREGRKMGHVTKLELS